MSSLKERDSTTVTGSLRRGVSGEVDLSKGVFGEFWTIL